MKKEKQIKYYYSTPIFILSLLLILVFALILLGVSYILIIKDFYLIIIIFIWLLYGLIFRDVIPRLIQTGKILFKQSPALILTENKLVDNINMQQFLWTDIENIDQYYDVRTGSYIAIKLKNPSDYLIKEKSTFNKLIMYFNKEYFNGIFAIRPQTIRCDKKELLKNLKSFLD